MNTTAAPPSQRIPSIGGLLAWLVLCLAVGGFAAWFTPGDWYAGLQKPSWTPPDAVFPPVWTALYLLMAGAAWLVWDVRRWGGAKRTLGLFVLQLLLNGAWSLLFFGLHRIDLALLDLGLLWLALLTTTWLFWRIRPLAAALMLPYLLWVSYAFSLNLPIWLWNG